MTIITEKKILGIFLFLLILIFIEGVICQPTIAIVELKQLANFLPFKFCKNYFFGNFWQENGIVENFQVFLLFLSIILIIKILILTDKSEKLFKTFFTIYFLALIYYLGEEISWGQHFFKWSTPDFFISYNNQNEINLHNISNIFDQLPRAIVFFWCGISVPTLIVMSYFEKAKFNEKIFNLVCPNKKLLIISILLLFFVIPDLIVDKLDLHPGGSSSMYHTGSSFLESGIFYDLITFNFIRLSEFHELIFCYYIFFHAFFYFKNLEKK